MYICKNRSGTVLDLKLSQLKRLGKWIGPLGESHCQWTGIGVVRFNWSTIPPGPVCLLQYNINVFFCVCWYCTVFWQHLLFPLKGGFLQARNISFAIWSNDFFLRLSWDWVRLGGTKYQDFPKHFSIWLPYGTYKTSRWRSLPWLPESQDMLRGLCSLNGLSDFPKASQGSLTLTKGFLEANMM